MMLHPFYGTEDRFQVQYSRIENVRGELQKSPVYCIV